RSALVQSDITVAKIERRNRGSSLERVLPRSVRTRRARRPSAWAASRAGGDHGAEARAAKRCAFLGEGMASLVPDEDRTAAVGLVGFPAHQARLDGGGHEFARPWLGGGGGGPR